jgi:hypothetical protein
VGNGYQKRDCELCNVVVEDKAPDIKDIDRRSASYKKAIKDIMDINPDITKDAATKMFDEAYKNG